MFVYENINYTKKMVTLSGCVSYYLEIEPTCHQHHSYPQANNKYLGKNRNKHRAQIPATVHFHLE
jgi:hypothetical protein